VSANVPSRQATHTGPWTLRVSGPASGRAVSALICDRADDVALIMGPRWYPLRVDQPVADGRDIPSQATGQVSNNHRQQQGSNSVLCNADVERVEMVWRFTASCAATAGGTCRPIPRGPYPARVPGLRGRRTRLVQPGRSRRLRRPKPTSQDELADGNDSGAQDVLALGEVRGAELRAAGRFALALDLDRDLQRIAAEKFGSDDSGPSRLARLSRWI
jgi:hypothetical protein